MKVLCVLSVFVAVAWAGPWPDDMAPPHATVAPWTYAEPAPYGLLDTIKSTVEDLLDSGVAIKDKVEKITEQVTEILEELQDFYEKATANKEDKIETIVQELCNRLVVQITKVLEYSFDEIAAVFLDVATKVDEMITGIWGEKYIRSAVQKVMNTVFEKYVDIILDALRAILQKIDYIQNDMVDDVLDSVEAKLHAKLEAFRDSLKERLSKRSLQEDELEDLVFAQNPANYIHESGCLVTFGVIGDLKEALVKVQDTLIWAKSLITDLEAKIDFVIKTVKEIRGEKDGLEKLMKWVQSEIEDIVLEFIDKVMKQVTAVIRSIIEKIDAWISDKFCPFKEKVYAWLDKVVGSTIENIMSVIQKVLKLLNKIEGGDWDGIVDHVMDVAEERLNDIFEDLRQHIKDKIAEKVGK